MVNIGGTERGGNRGNILGGGSQHEGELPRGVYSHWKKRERYKEMGQSRSEKKKDGIMRRSEASISATMAMYGTGGGGGRVMKRSQEPGPV